MDLSIRLFAGLRERAGADVLRLTDLPDGLDVGGLKRLLVERHPELGELGHVRGVLGTTYVDDSAALTGDEELCLIPPVSGGAPEPAGDLEQGVFEIRPEALDCAAALARVGHPSCGANCTFIGTTRDVNREQDVRQLDYEAFAEMAGAEMGRIFDECRAAFGPEAPDGDLPPDARRLRMLVQHRAGTVGVGEPSVVVAVASPHRDAAFAAARFLIDELKARVPLWKKESYEGGHHWIGERS
jgi:molybdopterin synthase catalytic subunit